MRFIEIWIQQRLSCTLVDFPYNLSGFGLQADVQPKEHRVPPY